MCLLLLAAVVLGCADWLMRSLSVTTMLLLSSSLLSKPLARDCFFLSPIVTCYFRLAFLSRTTLWLSKEIIPISKLTCRSRFCRLLGLLVRGGRFCLKLELFWVLRSIVESMIRACLSGNLFIYSSNSITVDAFLEVASPATPSLKEAWSKSSFSFKLLEACSRKTGASLP